jgi:hypothetical protein
MKRQIGTSGTLRHYRWSEGFSALNIGDAAQYESRRPSKAFRRTKIEAMLPVRSVTALTICVAIAFGVAPAQAEPLLQDPQNSICLMLESAARSNDLPLDFFVRVIWRESRFNSEAIGPVTRSGDRARGIAQFMPGTADERGLLDPFNPIQALPKAAEFLKELRVQFGNLGLAAAAYNAGPRRVRDWLAGSGNMPAETRSYVLAVTGRSVEEWAKTTDQDIARASMDCGAMVALLKEAPNRYVAALEARVQTASARPWDVELAANFSRATALAMYGRAITRLSGVIGDRDPIISSSALRTRGARAFYKVSIGAETHAKATTLCNRIRAAGGACIVMRNARA